MNVLALISLLITFKSLFFFTLIDFSANFYFNSPSNFRNFAEKEIYIINDLFIINKNFLNFFIYFICEN